MLVLAVAMAAWMGEHRPPPSGMSIAGGHKPMAGFRGDASTYPFLRDPRARG